MLEQEQFKCHLYNSISTIICIQKFSGPIKKPYKINSQTIYTDYGNQNSWYNQMGKYTLYPVVIEVSIIKANKYMQNPDHIMRDWFLQIVMKKMSQRAVQLTPVRGIGGLAAGWVFQRFISPTEELQNTCMCYKNSAVLRKEMEIMNFIPFTCVLHWIF